MKHPTRILAAALGLALLAPAPALATPDGLDVTGWALPSATDRLVKRNAEGLTTLSVAGVSLSADGRRATEPGKDARRLLRTAHHRGLEAEVLISNYSDRLGDFDARAAHRLLDSPQRIRAVAGQLARTVTDQGWDGVNVDLELVRKGDGDGLVDLVQALQDRMPTERTVSIDISAATTVPAYRARGYRVAGLADAADVIDVMTYDLHGPTWSGPGPVGALGWQRDALDALLSVVPADQVQLGVAGYGYTWPTRGTGRTVTVRQARHLVERDGAHARWRAEDGEWTATLSNGTVLWWSDRRSYDRRVALARERGLHGLAVWRLGSADTLH